MSRRRLARKPIKSDKIPRPLASIRRRARTRRHPVELRRRSGSATALPTADSRLETLGERAPSASAERRRVANLRPDAALGRRRKSPPPPPPPQLSAATTMALIARLRCRSCRLRRRAARTESDRLARLTLAETRSNLCGPHRFDLDSRAGCSSESRRRVASAPIAMSSKARSNWQLARSRSRICIRAHANCVSLPA